MCVCVCVYFTMTSCDCLPFHAVIVALTSSISHFETLEDGACAVPPQLFLNRKRLTCASIPTHLGTEAQPLVGGLYVICDNEEDLLALKTQLDGENKMQKVKLKGQIKPFPGSVLLICGDTC